MSNGDSLGAKLQARSAPLYDVKKDRAFLLLRITETGLVYLRGNMLLLLA